MDVGVNDGAGFEATEGNGDPAPTSRDDRLVQKPADYRKPAQRDCDRIMYSQAFRRLGGVTQVVAVNETHLFHNRLTHSLKVEQVARRMAERLVSETAADLIERVGGLDPDAAGAAALAHDLGHPPFGHVAETELNDCIRAEAPGLDGFEGNAQSFRIVTKLAVRTSEEDQPALNLTKATLRGILKYPWVAGEAPEDAPDGKWGAYSSERVEFEFAMGRDAVGDRSVEAELMDWADDVTYAVHDVEDFFRSGLIPLDRLVNDDLEARDFLAYATARLAKKGFDTDRCREVFDKLRSSYLPKARYTGSLSDEASLTSLCSALITRYTNAVSLHADKRVHIAESQRYEVNTLKELTWYYVIDHPALASLQRGQRHIVGSLFRALRGWAFEAETDKREYRRLPKHLRELIYAIREDDHAVIALDADPDLLRTRAVVDYIACLTEAQAIELYRRLCGNSEASVLDNWLAS